VCHRSCHVYHVQYSFYTHSVFLADRTNGRAIATLFRLSVRLSVDLSVCDVMYCG